MGLLKNEDRRKAKKASKKRKQPLRDPVFPPTTGLADDVDTTVLDVLSADGRGGAAGRGAAQQSGGYAFLERPPDANHSGAPSAESSSPAPAQGEAAIEPDETAAFALHLDAEPRITRPTAPAPEIPDPEPERARIEEELGIGALAASLAEYGSPPRAPVEPRTDRDALERELLRDELARVSRWKLGERREVRDKVREEAASKAQAEDEQLTAEEEQLQHELDMGWAELGSLAERATQHVDDWVNEETRRREEARLDQQATLDREWQRQMSVDPDSVTATLRANFPDGSVTVLGFLDGVSVLIVACPNMDGLIANTEPAVTSAGRPTMRARSPTRRNDLYLAAIASRVLAAVGRSLSASPAVEAVACIAARPGQGRGSPCEPIYVGTFERPYAERLVADGSWSTDPGALAQALVRADEVDLELVGRVNAVAALDLAADPGLRAVMDRLDPAIRSDEAAARRSDQQAVAAFLTNADIEPDARNEERADRSADVQIDAGATTQEIATVQNTASRGGSMPTEWTHQRSPGDLASEQAGQGSTRGGDPLLEAAKDTDSFVRRAAVEAIGRRNDPSDTPLLLQALSDRDDNVRLEAMYALKDRLSPDMRRDALIKACSDADRLVRRNAIETLAEVGDERDTPLLREALKDRDAKVRLEAIYALRHRLSPELRDAVVNACGDDDENVRRKAFEALAELRDERDTPLLLKALRDSDASVRLEAVYALEARTTLGSASKLSEPLAEAMKDEDAVVRHAAVRLFGRVQKPPRATRQTSS